MSQTISLTVRISVLAAVFHLTAVAGDPANPRDAAFKYVGRVLYESNAVAIGAGGWVETNFSGTSIRARFDKQSWGGSARVRMIIFNSSNTVVRTVFGTLAAGNGVSFATTGLANATYRVQLVREDSASNGALRFKGLTLDSGKTVMAVSSVIKNRKIEIYGDSVTAGSSAGNTTYESGVHSAYNAYANRLARLYGGTPWNNGLPGLGVLHGKSNFGGSSGGVGLEDTYDNIVLVENDLRTYNFASFKPQLVIMALGINDRGVGVLPNGSDLARWKTTYKSIVRDIATKHVYTNQKGPVFLFTVPPLGQHSIDAKAGVQSVANDLKGEGYDSYFWASYSNDLYSHGGNHPNSSDHVKISDQLKAYIDGNLLGELQARGW